VGANASLARFDGVPDDRLPSFLTSTIREVARAQLRKDFPNAKTALERQAGIEIANAGGHMAYLAKAVSENLEDGDGDGDGGS
jgi:hypothetical protein